MFTCCLAEQGADAADDTGHVMIGENEQRLARVDVDVERADLREARRAAVGWRAGHGELLHAAGERDFDGARVTEFS
jgi:hypothetical protein